MMERGARLEHITMSDGGLWPEKARRVRQRNVQTSKGG